MKLAKMKVVEMRKELEVRGLDSSGTRPTLMKRLKEALSREESNEPAKHHPEQLQEAQHRNRVENGGVRQRQIDRPNSESNDARPIPGQDTVDITETDNQLRSTDQTTARTDGAPPVNGTAQITQSKSLATGSIEQSSEISLDERMQKRRERFGTTKTPDPADQAIQRRRKRFGAVQKEENKPVKRRRPEVDKQLLKEHEEAKKRRAIKFGGSLNTGKEPGKAITADEMEKRLKRQRRFQQVGSQ